MNAKMKVLSLAMVGLCGFAGSAMAACPAGPTTAEGGAWNAKFVSPGSALAVVAGGLDGSACKATSALANSITAAATVTDNSPANEASYRFQFLVDPSSVSNFSATDSVVLFRANAGAAANGRANMLTVYMVAGPGGAKRLRFAASCNVAPTYVCAQSTSTDLPAGVTRIEGKLVKGPTGQFQYWVNAPQGTAEPAATGSIALNNDAWGGVKSAVLGLAAPTSAFAANHANQAVGFDTFDSRRQTYIGW